MDECTPQCKAMKLLVVGIVLILVRFFTTWDIWMVLGVLLVLKAIILLIMPVCPCRSHQKKKR